MNTHFDHHAWYKIRRNYPRYVLENDIARAQQTHLYEIIQRPYLQGVNYKQLLMNEFDTKTVKIKNKDTKIWGKFPDNLLGKWIERWIDRKTMRGDNKILGDPWYDRYYPNFYDNIYAPEIRDYNTYLGGGQTKWNPLFWEWFSNTYLLKDVYPLKYYPSGSYY